MLEFMSCVVEGIAANGVKGLMEFLPGGRYLHDVGEYAIRRYREKQAHKKLDDAVREMLLTPTEKAAEAARQAVDEAAPDLSPRERELVLQFMTAMPETARQSLKRKDDPTGTTLPPGYAVREASDVVNLLPQHPPRFVPGEWVPGREDNWRLERRLGGGGFGEVWLARHQFLTRERPRAVKFCTDPHARAKLVAHEKQLIERVMRHVGEHPNIVPLIECHLSGETPWLMYEFVEGGTLADAVASWSSLGPADRLTRALPVLHALAGAVAHCHALAPPVVHRDLKPANVMMAGGAPRVTDFGIGGAAVECLIADEKTRGYATALGRLPSMLSGSYSLMYSSPQQRDGERPDPRDDVHALGVMAYQALVGRVDLEVKGNWQKRLAADGVPAGLIDLLGDSTSHSPGDRPADAREWERVLGRFLPATRPASPPPPAPRPPVAPAPAPRAAAVPPSPAPSEPISRGWAGVWVAGCVGIMVLFGYIVWLSRTPGISAPRPTSSQSVTTPNTSDPAKAEAPAKVKQITLRRVSLAGEEIKAYPPIDTTPDKITWEPSLEYELALIGCDDEDVAAIANKVRGCALVYVTLSFCNLTDASLAHFAQFPTIKYLSVSGEPYAINTSPGGLVHLSALRELRNLSVVVKGRLTDVDVACLGALTKLEHLELSGEFPDAALVQIAKIANLWSLSLTSKSVTDQGLSHLSSLTKLNRLRICDMNVTGAGLEHVRGAPALYDVSIVDCPKMQAEHYQFLKNYPNLKQFSTLNSSFPSEAAVHLSGHAKLEELSITRRRSNQELQHVAPPVAEQLEPLFGDEGLSLLTDLPALRGYPERKALAFTQQSTEA